MKKWILLGGKSLPFFYETFAATDLASINLQMRGRKFDPSLFIGTADRCRFNHPKVIVCAPLRNGLPFPTSFWLTCPWLARRLGELESNGGVSSFENWMEQHSSEGWIDYNIYHQKLRLALLPMARRTFLRSFNPQFFKRLRSGGIGGICYERKISVKCLHLQTASWLALRRHPGAMWLREQGLALDCENSELCNGRPGTVKMAKP